MATRKNNPTIGDYYGAVDSVVLSKWMDINVMKSRPGKRRKKTTSVKLIRQNHLFGMVSSFLRSANELLLMGYQKPKVAKMTPMNAAASYHIKNAMTGDPDDPSVDLSLIRFTFPVRKTQTVWNPTLTLEEGKNVVIKWETNPFPQKSTQLDDQVILTYYNKNTGFFYIVRDIVERSDLGITDTFESGYTGNELHWYMFLISADGKLVSETEYLGMVTITA